jgi:cytochrome c peroxidase
MTKLFAGCKKLTMKRRVLSLAAAATCAIGVAAQADVEDAQRVGHEHLRAFANPSGYAATYSSAGFIDMANPFFQSLGSNGRSCASCHQQGEGWTVTPEGVQKRFHASHGTDPIFRLNDGANSPLADVSTPAARREAYSMLLSKGLIRVGIGIPENAEFELLKIDDPYGYASARELSLFRRPLPTTNLKFLSTVMWDARETFKDPASHDCLAGTTSCFASVHFDLADQSNSATVGHAQTAQPLTSAQRESIVKFELGLFTAQVYDHAAGRLTALHAHGGPEHAAQQTFYFGINDVLAGDYRTHAAFTPLAFNLFDAWANPPAERDDGHERVEARRAVARGQALFNTKPIQITQVKGLNDDLHLQVIQGSCTTCHDATNAGNHSVPAPLDIGLTDKSRRTTCLLHVAQQAHRGADRNHGPGTRTAHRQMAGRGALQGADPGWAGRTRTILPQRVGHGSQGSRGLL